MGAERVRGDTDGGDTAGRDRAHRALSPDREPPGVASDGQGSDNPDGEGSVSEQMGRIMGASLARGKDAWVTVKAP